MLPETAQLVVTVCRWNVIIQAMDCGPAQGEFPRKSASLACTSWAKIETRRVSPYTSRMASAVIETDPAIV
jgi:hypothetical protein